MKAKLSWWRIQTFAWYGGKPLNYSPTSIPRTQTIEPVYVETSAFYIFKHDMWAQHHRRVGDNPYMAIVGPVEGVDIDYPEDFELAEMMIGKWQDKQSVLQQRLQHALFVWVMQKVKKMVRCVKKKAQRVWILENFANFAPIMVLYTAVMRHSTL